MEGGEETQLIKRAFLVNNFLRSNFLQDFDPFILQQTFRMASPKIVAVFGATGNQGGSVAKSLLGNKDNFQVRGVTRNPDSERSKALVDLGATVVKADGFKRVEMIEAFRGAWGAFVNMNSDDKVTI